MKPYESSPPILTKSITRDTCIIGDVNYEGLPHGQGTLSISPSGKVDDEWRNDKIKKEHHR